MTVEELKALSPDEVKSLLKDKSISMRSIADELGINHSIVVCVIKGSYNGSEATIERVWNHITMALQSREDLNPIIYNDAPIFVELLAIGIKHKAFNDEATSKFIEAKKIISKSIISKN